MQLPPEGLEELARSMRAEAARALGEAFGGADLSALDEHGLARAEAILLQFCEDLDRSRALRGERSLETGGRKQLAERLFDELFGLGALQPFLDDREPDVEEVSVNSPRTGFLRRSGNQRERFDPGLRSEEELRDFIQRVVSRAGRRIDEASPYVSVRLEDGCRLTAVLPPLTEQPRLTVRIPRLRARSLEDLVELGTAEPELARFLEAAVRGRLNILVSGGTFSGKTTTLRALCGAISPEERVVTIEEDPELGLEGDVLPNCIGLWTRLPNLEGVGEVRVRQLVKLALRMCPDRIVVGEVRGQEAIDMLAAMNSGHEGSMCSIHADSGRRALDKLVQYVLQGRERWTARATRELIAESIDLAVQMAYDESSGRRLVSEVVEVAGLEDGVILTNTLFHREGGRLVASGVLPRGADRLRRGGWRG